MRSERDKLNKKIAIFLVIILSISSLYVIVAPKAKADPSDIKILSYSWYVSAAGNYPTSSAGDLVVVGEIQNVGTQPIDLPWVQAVAYTKDGQAAAVVYTTAYVKDLLPQQKAPFYLDFDIDASTGGNYSGTLAWIPLLDHVTATPGYANATADQMYRGLTLAAKTSFTSGNAFTVTGIIQNNGSQLTGNVWAVTTFYNSTGGAIAVNTTDFLANSLAPGSTIPFTATPMDNTAALSSQIESYSVLIQTMPPQDLPSSSPTPTASQSPSSSPTATPVISAEPTQSSEGQQQSSSSLDLVYIVVALVVAAVVIVAAFVLLRKKR